jgi:predicted pyridoxine 5'-phosphate oxidase superfamily flavin-nucleotide-binding protein
MAENYLEYLVTEGALQAQRAYYGQSTPTDGRAGTDALTTEEIEFIGQRDSFYLATVSNAGWPYIQHRGGKPGFLRVVTPTRLAFGDYRGNRQLISVGNLSTNDKASLFLMDYPQRTRLKILGHIRVEDARDHRDLVKQFAEPEVHGVVERLFFIDVVSFDWNCPKYITPRYTPAEIEDAVRPLRQRIVELETQLKIRP